MLNWGVFLKIKPIRNAINNTQEVCTEIPFLYSVKKTF